jgi:4-hydroxybenzoate polyprenyltransferase
MKSKLTHLWHASRAEDWRLSLVPFVIGCIYLWIGFYHLPFNLQTLLLFTLSVITTFGFAALGYFINEFFDKKTDLLAGKKNRLVHLPILLQLFLFLLCLSLALIPWLSLPANGISVLLITLEILLFLLYSLPFPKLKSIPVISSLVDAAYAYAVPLLLTFHTYSLFANHRANQWMIFLLLACVIVIGVRNITIHHINDLFKDQRSNTKTLPQVIGVFGTTYLLITLLVLEIALMLITTLYFISDAPFWSTWLIAYCIFIAWRLKELLPLPNVESINLHPLRHLTDPAYQYIFPLVALLYVIYIHPGWTLLLPFHLAFLFPLPFLLKAKAVLSSAIVSFYYMLKRLSVYVIVYPTSLTINYAIYFLFLAFGVNLRKEGIDAWSYLKRKFA